MANNGIDSKLRVRYQYAQPQGEQSKKHLDALICFLLKQRQLQKGDTDQ